MHFKDVIEARLGEALIGVHPLSGGDINEVYKLELAGFNAVLKLNSKERHPLMFQKEALGLELLRKAGCSIPGVIQTFEDGKFQYLILEFIQQGRSNRSSWKKFGHELATLHLNTNDLFGLDHDNYIGSLTQENSQESYWSEFFTRRRLEPLIKNARDRNLLSTSHLNAFSSLFSRLDTLIPKETPALLHGDLWSGNLMFDTKGNPVFIDPAVYYGHREIDIAMTHMFGGFNSQFLETYNEFNALEKGWEERIQLHNLYPTLVHLVLFGSSYLGGIERTLGRYA